MKVSIRATLKIVILGVAFFVLQTSPSRAETVYEKELLARAEQRTLWLDPTWLALGLYRPNFFGSGFESIVDDSRFFIAKTGKYNPQAELLASISSLFHPEREQIPGLKAGCMYQGRRFWLTKALGVRSDKLPRQHCEEFDAWYRALAPESLSLIFPEAYLNNPASMFGHTLLRVNGKGQDEATRLLAYSVTYGADHREPPGVIYAFKGLFGFYSGKFSVGPYYETVRKYSDIEHRDIWEYQLDLSLDELELILRHIWELRDIGSDYYFFTENCSFLLLAILDTARPELKLQDDFDGLWAIPSETVRAISSRTQLVSTATFRPSASTRLKWMLQHLSKDEARLAKKISNQGLKSNKQKLTPLSDSSQSKVLEAAFDLLRYQKKDLESLPEQRKKAQEILQMRSSLSSKNVFPDIPTPARRPDQGHLPGKLFASVGAQDSEAFYELGVRPAYHELLDPQEGYKAGTQLIVFDILARQNESHSLNIEHFQLLNTASLAPRDTFFDPISWKAQLGLRRLRRGNSSGFMSAESRLGLGHTYNISESSYIFVFAESAILNSPSLEENYSIGLGGSFGLVIGNSNNWRHLIQARLLRHPLGEQFTDKQYTFESRFLINRKLALRGLVGQKGHFNETEWELKLGVERFF